MSLTIEEKYEPVRNLISVGKERGYLLTDEINDILPPKVSFFRRDEDLLSAFERHELILTKTSQLPTVLPAGLKSPSRWKCTRRRSRKVSGESELTSHRGLFEKTSDPVRM